MDNPTSQEVLETLIIMDSHNGRIRYTDLPVKLEEAFSKLLLLGLVNQIDLMGERIELTPKGYKFLSELYGLVSVKLARHVKEYDRAEREKYL